MDEMSALALVTAACIALKIEIAGIIEQFLPGNAFL
jgi:hypothetical protein